MNATWFVRVDREHAAQVARLREVTGLHVAEAGEEIWLRAAAASEALDRQLAGLRGERFVLSAREQLVPWGKRVPTQPLPELHWQPISTWSEIALPVAALPARPDGRLRLRLVRGGTEQSPKAILLESRHWFCYATTAPEIRLRSLAFALSADRRVFLCGTPLPPLVGRHYSLDGGIAVACGWSFSPAVGGKVVRTLLNLAEGDVALFADDGSFERLAGEHFVAASRSAVRASVRQGA